MSQRVQTWRHLNQPLRYKGLTSAQLGVGLLVPLTLMGFNILLAFVVMGIEMVVWRWLRRLQQDGDVKPLVTRTVKNNSPHLIQDDGRYYENLMSDD